MEQSVPIEVRNVGYKRWGVGLRALGGDKESPNNTNRPSPLTILLSLSLSLAQYHPWINSSYFLVYS